MQSLDKFGQLSPRNNRQTTGGGHKEEHDWKSLANVTSCPKQEHQSSTATTATKPAHKSISSSIRNQIQAKEKATSSELYYHYHCNRHVKIRPPLLLTWVVWIFMLSSLSSSPINVNQWNGFNDRIHFPGIGSQFFVMATSESPGTQINHDEPLSPATLTSESAPNGVGGAPFVRRMVGGYPPSSNASMKLRGGSTTKEAPDDQESKAQQTMTLSQIFTKAGKRGLGGGLPGAVAGVVQVLTLMWLRTVMNYQCRYGTTFRQALVTLFNEGGIPRFYRGLSFALVQAPLARFVSTAANDGVETLLASLDATKSWGPGRSTIVASFVVGMWRMFLMPIDTCKTVLQVDSAEGFRNLMRKVKAGKINVLYQGAVANAISAIAAHYPWFYTYNFLNKSPIIHVLIKNNLLRNAGIGFVSSIISDSIANVVRVIKTTKQAYGSKHCVSYGEVIAMILAADGWKGLFGRGLKTRILANAVQSVVFTIIWRGLAERWGGKSAGEKKTRSLKRETGEDIVRDEEDEYMFEEESY